MAALGATTAEQRLVLEGLMDLPVDKLEGEWSGGLGAG